ncbi:hypothetical protein EV715DRAFT_202979 [Schizophyllum commune]
MAHETTQAYQTYETSAAYQTEKGWESSSESWASTTESAWQASATEAATSTAAAASGNGATHTVIVAPTQGVLRYVPFAVNASVGDTIHFEWKAGPHTVTKSSSLAPCNKTADAFASGMQNASFTFDQIVNDTNPTFFYCAVPNHCQKGMFGVINPPSLSGSNTSADSMMADMVASNPDLAAYAKYTDKQTVRSAVATSWGGNMDLAGMPDWSMPLMMENLMYTRNFLAMNKEVLTDDGKVDLSAGGQTPFMWPQNLDAVVSGAASSSAAAPSATFAAGGSAASSAAPAGASASGASSAESALNNGASSLASPRMLAVVVAAFGAFLLL